ncbi:histidinol dehydrogenase [Renibacterium salmoninarum ATCC 33209]|uniref:Histidinol dehydrogenase n=1 Tax=Renibacterium salmoninarum (strain ATCC 33209 / DSM 20767 / JCM 11484 / NBRC 15589 / NCIMB 2235) TaxID=288705 RepID=A9WS76_RENSM|nr:histidinol dehydrogenase [Renibacterium salmoninarum ATCC 33209]
MVTSTRDPQILRSIDLRGQKLSLMQLRRELPRVEAQSAHDAEASVQNILDSVRTGGLTALRELAQRFDGVTQNQPRVPQSALQQALAELDPAVRAALEESLRRASAVAQAQRPEDVPVQLAPGANVLLRWEPIRRVGLYVPGGLAAYASSVVMNVVPALAAGVGSIALASPPQKDNNGLPHPSVLAAAALLGIEEVYAIGGAQAIGALAYGIPETAEFAGLEPVDMVTGPGNIFVATAKRLVKGLVGIDAEAGPTEIMVLADESASAPFVAADLISQAEHDPFAASVLVTDSARLAEAVQEQLVVQLALTKHQERVAQALGGEQAAVVLVDSIAAGIDVASAYAAEHLEVMTVNSAEDGAKVRSAGAIFLGSSSPVSLGDYCAGSNHILPTGGTAAFASGLGVHTFLKAIQIIDYDRSALEEVAGHIIALAQVEGLPGHGDAVSIRLR